MVRGSTVGSTRGPVTTALPACSPKLLLELQQKARHLVRVAGAGGAERPGDAALWGCGEGGDGRRLGVGDL